VCSFDLVFDEVVVNPDAKSDPESELWISVNNKAGKRGFPKDIAINGVYGDWSQSF
jgi:hypothetical protein